MMEGCPFASQTGPASALLLPGCSPAAGGAQLFLGLEKGPEQLDFLVTFNSAVTKHQIISRPTMI